MTPETSNPGTLFIVATPIGNLGDITLRALKVLREVNLIAAEDTRKTRKLLSAHDIHKPLVSLYDQVEERRSGQIIRRLLNGESVAYVSEAGTPGISDPGYLLINAAIAAGVNVSPVPGPSAVVAALSAAGLPMNTFLFLGFAPSQASKRRKYFEAAGNAGHTLVFYESPQRVVASLEDMLSVFGNRRVVLARELTKVHEEMLRGDLTGIIDHLREKGSQVKGEITIIVEGARELPAEFTDSDIISIYRELSADPGLTTRDIIMSIARRTGLPRSRVYNIVARLK